MKLLTIYQGCYPDVVEVWHPDLKKILFGSTKVLTLKRKSRSSKVARKPFLEYETNIKGTIFTDGFRKQKSTTKVRFV